MAKQLWLVTTQSKSQQRLNDGTFDISTFTGISEDPVDSLLKAREGRPDAYWSVLFAMKITATQAKRLNPQ